MLQFVSSAFQSFVDLFVVTAPSIKVEELPDTSDAGGCVHRLTEASGEYRDIYVLSRVTKNPVSGEKVAVIDLASPATNYVNILKIDHENTNLRGRPRVSMERLADPLSFEDHEALVAFEESNREKFQKAGIKLEIVRLYPATPPKEGSAENDTKKFPELKL